MRSIPDSCSISRGMKNALENEARKMVARNARSFAKDFMSIVLWSLHEKYGWGRKKLLDYYYSVMPSVQALKDHYEMQDTADTAFLCTVKLKDLTGVDMDELTVEEMSVEVKIG